MERDLELSGGDNNDGYFNSHAHVERDRCVADKHTIIKNFNSHAHVERDLLKDSIKETKAISTHTLTWSVTTL